jgi:hypothetical protein
MPKSLSDQLPSYKGLLKAIRKTGNKDKKMAHKQMKWANEFYAEAKDLNKDVVADLQEVMDFQLGNMKEDRDRYVGIYQKLEDEQMDEINDFQGRVSKFDEEVAKLKEEAVAWGSEANQKYMAGKAIAGVGQAFASKKAETERALLDMGVNPNSGASQSLTAGLNAAEGAAQAAAGTTAADATRQESHRRVMEAMGEEMKAGALAEAGLRMQGGMVAVGQTYPGQVAVEAGQVGTAGAQAVDSTVGIADAATRARSLAAEYHRLNAANLSTWADALGTKTSGIIGAYNADTSRMTAEAQIEANESSGLGSALGIGASVLRGFFPGGGAVGAATSMFAADGGVVEPEAVQFLQGGGGVGDPNVSGTGGATGNRFPTGPTASATMTPKGTDTAPAMLTPGEFVVPKNVVDWHGQKFFQDLIKKVPTQKQDTIAQTGAQIAMRPTGPGALTL